MFPIVLQDNELQWKLAVEYDAQKEVFILCINGRAFLTLPHKASLATPVPQNIEQGEIKLNGVEVHSGFIQYTEDTFHEWFDEHRIESVTQAYFGGFFACSSSNALNSVFDDLGLCIDLEQGLKKLEISGFADKNTLEEWALSQLVIKSH